MPFSQKENDNIYKALTTKKTDTKKGKYVDQSKIYLFVLFYKNNN